MYADLIAYINHDIEDAIRAGYLTADQLPRGPVSLFGNHTSERIHSAILDIYRSSYGKPYVRMSEPMEKALGELRAFMFEHVYERANKVIQESAERMLGALYTYFVARPELLPALYRKTAETDVPRAVCDYLSSMTDKYAIGVFKELFVPREGGV